MKQRTLSIGDPHGLRVVDLIVQHLKDYDKIIVVGDYVDSFEVDNMTIQSNLYDLIELKKRHPDKIVLLWGNHDIQYYLGYAKHGCSGYRAEMKDDLYDMFKENKNLFQFAFQIDNYIWTHAGISIGWYEYSFSKYLKISNLEDKTLAEQLNDAFRNNFEGLFDVGHYRGGYKDVGGPLWADRRELHKPLKNYHQIVGHSKLEDIRTVYTHNDTSITFIDVLEINKENFFRESLLYKLNI